MKIFSSFVTVLIVFLTGCGSTVSFDNHTETRTVNCINNIDKIILIEEKEQPVMAFQEPWGLGKTITFNFENNKFRILIIRNEDLNEKRIIKKLLNLKQIRTCDSTNLRIQFGDKTRCYLGTWKDKCNPIGSIILIIGENNYIIEHLSCSTSEVTESLFREIEGCFPVN